MHAAGLLCLLFAGQVAPAAGNDAAREQAFREVMIRANEGLNDTQQTDAAIEALTQYLADEDHHSQLHQYYTAAAYQMRGQLLLKRGRAEAALADFDQSLAILPENLGVQFVRADALDALGRGAEATAARTAAKKWLDELEYGGDWQEMFAVVFDSLESLLDLRDLRLRDVAGLLILFGPVCGTLFLLNLWCAWTQWRESRGRWQRLVWVCAVFVLLEIAPLAVLLVWELASPGRGLDWSFAVTFLVACNVFVLLKAQGRPVQLPYRKGALPLVADAAFLQRVAELSQRMGVAKPVVRMFTSLGGEQQVMAFAGGLTAPSVVIADGILHRLEADERDAIVAHELAHHANGSIWWLVSVPTFAICCAIAFDPLAPEPVTFVLAFALRVGLYRIVSRYFERDCDRRAAAVFGFRNCSSALRKIHAVHPLRNAGWLSVLIYATATHPSITERLHALCLAAPEEDKPDVEWSVADYRRRRIVAVLAGLLWAGLVTVSVMYSMAHRRAIWPAIVLAIIAVVIPLFPLLGTLRQVRRNRRRAPTGRWKRLLPLIASALLLFALFRASDWLSSDREVRQWWQLLTSVICLIVVLGWLLLSWLWTPRYAPEKRNELLSALHDHDFARAAKYGLDNARKMARVPDFRHNTAVAIALAGDYPRGLAELQSNFRDHPKFLQSLLTQSALYLEEGDVAQSLALARQAGERLPGDPEPLIKEAWALRRIEQTEEAEAAARRALELEEGQAGPHLVLAALAIDRNDEATARDELALAERLSPGSPFGKLVEAEAALKFDTPAAAEAAIERAAVAAKANPFAVIDRQVARLREQLPEMPS